MRIKVVEFINRIQDGGAETLIKDYALLLDKQKFDLIVLCYFAKKNSSVYKKLQENNVTVIQLYGKFTTICRVLSKLSKKLNSLLLSKKIKDIKPDVLHCHLEVLETVYNSRKELNDVKIIYTCHNLPKTLIGSDLPKENYAAKYLIENNNLQIVALHENMAKEINEMFEVNNTVVIRNGIDLNKFKNVYKDKISIRECLGIPKEAYVVGNIGRLSYQKNSKFIVDIFDEMFKKNKNSFLLMVGEGKDKYEILKKVNEKNLSSRFLLLSQRGDIPEILKSLDVFLFPSRYEGLGIVLIEAQAANISCVVSDKIPKDAYRSNKICELPLESSISEWADACLNPKNNVVSSGRIDDYEMIIEIRKLENLYLSNF